MLAAIPSPTFNVFEIGPLDIHVYGILIATGVAVAAVISRRRYEMFGGDPRLAERVAVWAVVFGFLGARFAYVLPRLSQFSDNWLEVFAIWQGGLALFGGITVGGLTAFVLMRRWDGDILAFSDAVAIGLPAAQAIGRWGNYFNQELFGTPTDLPWGLEIAPENRPAQYADAATFHPTFLYESLWNVFLIVGLLWVERRGLLRRRGSLFALYLVGYGVGRFLTELIRTDTSFRFLELSRNAWVSLAAILVGILWVRMRERGADTNETAVEADQPGRVEGG